MATLRDSINGTYNREQVRRVAPEKTPTPQQRAQAAAVMARLTKEREAVKKGGRRG